MGKSKDSHAEAESKGSSQDGVITSFKPIKRCGCGCKPKPKGGVITIKGVVDQKYVEVGKNGARFLSEEDLIEARRNRVFNFISENPGQESRSSISGPSTPRLEKKNDSIVRCCGKEDCFCENCDFCGVTSMASLPLDFDSNSNILNFNNEFKEKPAKAQLPNSNLPVSDPSVSSILSFNKDGINLKPDQPIFNFNFPQNVQSTPRSSSISESQFINVSIHDYGSEAQTPQSSVSRKASCCGGSSKPSKPAVPISSCCSSGSVAPNSRSSCCSGNSVAPISRSSCCSGGSATPISSSSAINNVKFVPQKLSMPKGSCCSSKSFDTNESSPLDIKNLNVSSLIDSESSSTVDSAQMAKQISDLSNSGYIPSQDIHSSIGSVQDSISAGIIAPSNDSLRPPNFILPMGSNLDDVLLSILSTNNSEGKAELPDLVSYLENERDNLNEFIPSPPMEMTVAASCVLPGQCKCDENCRCPGCSTHKNPPQNLMFLGSHPSSIGHSTSESSSTPTYSHNPGLIKSTSNKGKGISQFNISNTSLQQNSDLNYFGNTQFDISKEGLGSYVSSEQLSQQSNSNQDVNTRDSFSSAFDISLLSSSNIMSQNIQDSSFPKVTNEPGDTLFSDISQGFNNFDSILTPENISINESNSNSSHAYLDSQNQVQQPPGMFSYTQSSSAKKPVQNNFSGPTNTNPLYSAVTSISNNTVSSNGASKGCRSCCLGNHKKTINPPEPSTTGFNVNSYSTSEKNGLSASAFNVDSSLDGIRKDMESERALSPSSVTSPITAYGS